MPIKTAPSTTIPFLEDYTVYSIPKNSVLAEDISDMITYDVQPVTNTTVDYSIGTDKTYVTTMSIKNITTNCTIKLMLTYNTNIFIIDRNNFTQGNNGIINIELKPSQAEDFIIEVNTQQLNQRITYTPEETQIKIVLENIAQDGIVLRAFPEVLYDAQVLPEIITLD